MKYFNKAANWTFAIIFPFAALATLFLLALAGAVGAVWIWSKSFSLNFSEDNWSGLKDAVSFGCEGQQPEPNKHAGSGTPPKKP